MKVKRYHDIQKIEFEKGMINLVVDGIVVKRALEEISRRLASATEEELNTFEVSPSGYGIHWPLLDEDISIDGLLGVVHGSPQRIEGRKAVEVATEGTTVSGEM